MGSTEAVREPEGSCRPVQTKLSLIPKEKAPAGKEHSGLKLKGFSQVARSLNQIGSKGWSCSLGLPPEGPRVSLKEELKDLKAGIACSSTSKNTMAGIVQRTCIWGGGA